MKEGLMKEAGKIRDYEAIKNHLSHMFELQDIDRGRYLDSIIKDFQPVDVVSVMAEVYNNQYEKVSKAVYRSEVLKTALRTVKRIGVYYHKLSYGGTERIVSIQIKMLVEMGYGVVFFSDEAPSVGDFKLPDSVKRVIIDEPMDSKGKDYYDRARKWEKALKENDIDVVIHHAWKSRRLIWDSILMKSFGIEVIIYTHGVFSTQLEKGYAYFAKMPYIYSIPDGVVTLSRVDLEFWQHFNKNSIYIPNPIVFEKADNSGFINNKIVLWVGRLSREKNPTDAVKIIAQAVKTDPDIKLKIVGDASNEEIFNEIKDTINSNEIENNVEICGFQSNIEKYYREASLLLVTSAFEGFPTMVMEAKAFGVPYIGYSIPHLELERMKKGLKVFPQGDVDSVSNAIVEVLNDNNALSSFRMDALKSMDEYSNKEVKAFWKKLLDGVSEMDNEDHFIDSDETTEIMWDYLFSNIGMNLGYIHRFNKLNKKVERLTEKNDALKANNQTLRDRIENIYSSKTYRTGNVLLSIPKRIKNLFK